MADDRVWEQMGQRNKHRIPDLIEKYAAEMGPDETLDTTLVDLLVDLHHWARANGIDWTPVYERSVMLYDGTRET